MKHTRIHETCCITRIHETCCITRIHETCRIHVVLLEYIKQLQLLEISIWNSNVYTTNSYNYTNIDCIYINIHNRICT